MKNLLLILIVLLFLTSCGKKGDPEYKDSTIKKSMQLLVINKV